MEIKENMTAEEVQAYREWAGCSLLYVRQQQIKLEKLRLLHEAKTVADLRPILESMIYRLYA